MSNGQLIDNPIAIDKRRIDKLTAGLLDWTERKASANFLVSRRPPKFPRGEKDPKEQPNYHDRMAVVHKLMADKER